MKRKKRALSTYFRKEQPCWTCSRCYGECSWSSDFIPVKGWKAKKTVIPSNYGNADSYKIIDCPEYVEEKRR